MSRYWLPPLLWSAVILLASSDLFSAPHTGSLLETLLTSLGLRLSPQTLAWVHMAIRKAGHLTVYGILGALYFRAMRAGRSPEWQRRWAVTAVVLATVIAVLDEWHQTYVPSRTGSATDVLIDAAGAIAAQIIIRAAQMLFFVA